MTRRKDLADPADPRDRDAPLHHSQPPGPGREPKGTARPTRAARQGDEKRPDEEFAEAQDEGSARTVTETER